MIILAKIVKLAPVSPLKQHIMLKRHTVSVFIMVVLIFYEPVLVKYLNDDWKKNCGTVTKCTSGQVTKSRIYDDVKRNFKINTGI